MLQLRQAANVTAGALLTMGAHTGTARRVARAMRATCRTVPSRWADDIADLDETRHLTLDWLAGLDHNDADVVTWVPGHAGSPGPALLLARLTGDAWGLPIEQLTTRRHRLPSAWSTPHRPATATQLVSLRPIPCSARRVIVVDNTIATGASMAATTRILRAAGHQVMHQLAITTTLKTATT